MRNFMHPTFNFFYRQTSEANGLSKEITNDHLDSNGGANNAFMLFDFLFVTNSLHECFYFKNIIVIVWDS